MVTENVNIRFRESGARVIKRRIDEIGESANRATRGIFLLQRALFVIGGAGIARGLASYADALTNVENRLRLTTDSTAQLEAVQSELFNVSRRSRSDFIATADVYNRIALSARNLGVGQRQILNVTETLQKAAIISGASAREANAALIQLGQGIASDRLSGDELRSVLEQLPAVADILVDFLNDTGEFGEVTRGSLRQLGREGQLTADLVFRAIESAQANVDALFAQTNPTIEQAFNVARTNLLEFIDTFDDATGASAAVARAIIGLSENFDILLGAVGAVAAAFTGLFAANLVARIRTFISGINNTGVALTRYRSIATATAAVEANADAQRVRSLQVRQAELAITARGAAAKLAEAQANARATATQLAQNGARDAATGRIISNQAATTRLIQSQNALAVAQQRVNAITALQTRNTTALAAAQNTAAGSSARLAGAQAAQSGVLARLTATFPTLAGAARLASGAVRGLFGLLAANPIAAVVTAIVAAGFALFTFGDRIKVTEDGVVSLRDAAVAAFQLIVEAVAPVAGAITGAIGGAVDFVLDKFNVDFRKIIGVVADVAAQIINALTIIPRFAIAIVAGIVAAFQALGPGAGSAVDGVVDVFVTGFEFVAQAGIDAINSIIGAFNRLAGTRVGELLGLDEIGELADANFDGLRTSFGDGGQGVGDAFAEGFSSSLESTRIENILSGFGESVIERARANIAAAEELAGEITDSEGNSDSPGGPGGAGGRGGGGNSTDFASELAQLQQQIELERQFGIQKEITNNILAVEQALKRELTATEQEQIANATRLIEVSRIQGEILQETLGPAETLRFTQAALNQLFSEGAITLEQYNTRLRETQIAADRAADTLGGGFRAAIASSIQSAGEFGEALGGVVVGAANNAADAIVEFAKTGQFNIRQFFQDLFAQLLRLAAQRLLLQFIGGFLGIPGAGLAGLSGGGTIPGARLGGQILPSFAGGGSLSPTGPGSTDTEIVAFNKRPDERVDILTPGQQAAQNRRLNGMDGGGTTVVQSPPVNVVAQLGTSDVVNAFDNAEGETVIINMLQRNATTVRQIAQS